MHYYNGKKDKKNISTSLYIQYYRPILIVPYRNMFQATICTERVQVIERSRWAFQY